MKIQQISLFAENKPGHIAAPVRLLAREGIDIRSMYLADTQQYGILRMIVSDWQKAATVLEAQEFVVKVKEVLAVEVPDRPGGLADVLMELDPGHDCFRLAEGRHGSRSPGIRRQSEGGAGRRGARPSGRPGRRPHGAGRNRHQHRVYVD